MIKLVLIGIWACLMTLASSYAATYWKASQEKVAAAEPSSQNVEYKKTKEFTVPKIADGAIQGYIITQLAYSSTLATFAENHVTAPPEAFLLDEAFRYIYADDSMDFNNMKKYDLQKLTKTLVQNVNTRLNANVVKDVLISGIQLHVKSGHEEADMNGDASGLMTRRRRSLGLGRQPDLFVAGDKIRFRAPIPPPAS